MNDKKVMLHIGRLSTVTTIGSDSASSKKTEHFHTVGECYIRLGADEYLYIEERCIECGKILNERRIKTEPLLEDQE